MHRHCRNRNLIHYATGDAVEKLAEQGLLAIEGNGSRLSLKATGEALEGSGYTKVE